MRLKTPPPDEQKSWDKFRQFHWGVNVGLARTSQYTTPPFVLFDTGELCCTRDSPRPYDRHDYGCVGVRIVGSSDSRLPKLFTPELREPVPKAWLGQNLQFLLVDHETGRVVSLDKSATTPHLPEHLSKHGFTAFFPKQGAVPVGGPVRVYRPWNKVPGVKEHVHDMVKATRMMFRLKEIETYWFGGNIGVQKVLDARSPLDLTPGEQQAVNAGAIGRVMFEYPYLIAGA